MDIKLFSDRLHFPQTGAWLFLHLVACSAVKKKAAQICENEMKVSSLENLEISNSHINEEDN